MRESFDCVSALGEGMRLEVIDHGGTGASKEFIVAAPKFNFKKWLTLTLALRLVNFVLRHSSSITRDESACREIICH